MKSRAYRLLLPYVVAIASTGIALLLTLWLEPLMSRTLGAFFYIAVIVSTWYGGISPGLLAVILSLLALNYYFIPPLHQFWGRATDDWLRLAIFTVIALMMALISGDLKESKRKVERLSRKLQQESAEHLKTALNAAQMGMWDWDIVTGKITWSPEHEVLLGLAPGSFDGRYETFDACLYPDDREGLERAIEQSLKNRIPYQHEYRVVWADGSIHWVEGRGKVFYNAQGQPVRMSGTIMAIDARKQAEAALQEREAILRLFVQYAPAGIAMLDRDMRYLMASQCWVDEYNLDSLESLINRSHYEIFPEIPEQWRQIHQRCLAGAIEKCDEDLFVREDGTQQWISWEIHPWYTATDEIGGIIVFSIDITTRKQAEIVLKKSQNQIQRQLFEIETIYHSAPIGLSVLDTELRFVRINQRLAEINGLPVEAHINRTVREVVPNLADTAEQLLRSILETGEPVLNVEITGETPAQPGVQRTWIESWLPLKDGDTPDGTLRDRIIGINIVCEEITERKKAQLALEQLNAELEQRVAQRTAELTKINDRLLETVLEQQHTQIILLEQAQLLDLAHDTIITCDLTWVITFWNQGAERMYGWTQAEALGKETHTLLQTQFPQTFAEIKAQLFEQGYWQGELIHLNRNNESLIVASRWVLQKDEMGRPIKILEINNNITSRKQAENDRNQAELALRESEERRRLALDLTHIGFWDFHLPSNNIIWNDNHFTLLRLVPNEIEPSYELWRSHVHPDDLDWVEPQFMESIANHTDYAAEYRVVHPDGSVHWLMGRSRAIYDELGQPLRSIGVLLDISDRKRIEEALLQSEQMFRSLSDFSPIGIFLCDVTGKCIYSNPCYQQIVGCTGEEALGDGWKEFIHPGDREWVFQYWSDVVAIGKEGLFNELRYQDREGDVRYTQVRTAPIKSSDGTIVLFVGVVEDITERRKIDQMKKDFISVVSHELRTPLTSIRGSLGLVAGGVYDKKPEKMKEMIDIAARQSDRLVRLVNDILDLRRLESGQTTFNFKHCAAAELIQQSVDVMRSQAEQNHITLCIIPSEVQVWADCDALVQTLTNLLSNAIKFSHQNSNITISAQVPPDNLLTQKQLPSSVLFSVQDQGRGIPEDKLETIFGQFQQVDASDAREKGGTGLGLAICRNIIEQHGGKIWAESVLNEGSTFYFTIPLST